MFGAAFGSGAAITLTGTAGAELLIGGRADDVLTGNGGADRFRGGAGDDLISIGTTNFADIDGGTGHDTLALAGSGLTLNLATLRPAEIQSIGRIDLTGTGNNTLVLDSLAFYDLTEERGFGPTVRVEGNAGDAAQLHLPQFVNIGSAVMDGITYNRYLFDPNGGSSADAIQNAQLWIDQDIALTFF